MIQKSFFTNRLLLVYTCLFGIAGIFLLEPKQPVKIKKIPKRDRMDLAWKQEREMTRDLETGEVPKERLLQAWKYIQQRQFQMGKAAIAGISWVERGPTNCGGRTRAICVDLNDPTGNTLWAGGVAGGLWKTTNINSTTPNWTPVNDFFQNMAITYIDQAPGNTNVLYFCTGEGNGNLDAVRGLGVWKSTDAGATWAQLTSTNTSSFHYCQKVLSLGNGDTVFVATNTGLYRSVNGGTAFSRVLGSSTTTGYDIERMANGTLYATVSGVVSSANDTGSIHKSTNRGATWTAMPLPSYLNQREIEIAVADNDTNTIWGLVEDGGEITAIIRSLNAGATWDTTATYPVDADPGIQSTTNPKDFSRGQAWYDLSIAVDPNNSSVCFVGGIDLFKTSNGGASWSQISHWYGGFGFQEVHADQHYALFAPGSSSVIYFANDGGVYRSSNATAATPTISSREIGYNTTQFYACDIHPNTGSNVFLAGAQDNGSHRFSTTGINSTNEVTGGDGAFCHIDQDNPSIQFTSYVYNNYYRSTDGGLNFSGITNDNTGRFINPTDYDDAANTLYAARGSNQYCRILNANTSSTISSVSVTALNGTVSAIKVSPNTSRRIFLGTGAGRVVRVDSAHATPIATHINSGAGMPTGYISCIDVWTGNDSNLLVSFSNYGVSSIWLTRNGGSTWTSVEGNLPDMPVRWIVFNPNNRNQAIIATELGVWSTDSLNGASTDWQPSNTGLANVRCDMIKVRASDKTMIVATHGRGLYSSTSLSAPTAAFTSDKTLAYPNKPIQFTNGSINATSFAWNFGDGTTSTLQNPTKTYTQGGTYTVTLTVNGGASIATQQVTVMPYRGVPYTAANGGNFETNTSDFIAITEAGTGFERGNSTITSKNGVWSGSNAWVTGLTSSQYLDNSVAYLYTPSFNCTASGTYTVRFYLKNSFEIGYDGFRVEYSLNGGDTWTPLGTTTATNWYDYANTGTGRPFPQNQAFFNALNSSYSLKSFATTLFQGNNEVCFRIVFKSDVSVPGVGMAIDDFELQGPSNSALPVNWGAVSGKRINVNTTQISWRTLTESDNAGFEVQRLDQATQLFNPLGFVKGKGNTRVMQSYQFIDNNALPTAMQYRIKQMDFNGTVSYSKAIFIGPDLMATTGGVSLVPTYTKNEWQLQGDLTNPISIQVFNGSGQVVLNGTYAPMQLLKLDGLASGIYYVRYETQTKPYTIKLLVQ
ncbi:MAG: PKD domain-containing protein [Bacteroidia bacterium]|jgi:PKD repeat protein|nr:PKD domain-containing protein [Bacteroidia bacterium]